MTPVTDYSLWLAMSDGDIHSCRIRERTLPEAAKMFRPVGICSLIFKPDVQFFNFNIQTL